VSEAFGSPRISKTYPLRAAGGFLRAEQGGKLAASNLPSNSWRGFGGELAENLWERGGRLAEFGCEI